MKIYSDFNTFFDGPLYSFEEDAKIWNRKTSTVELRTKNPGKEKLTKFVFDFIRNQTDSIYSLVAVYVIAGKTYPVVRYDDYLDKSCKLYIGWEEIEAAEIANDFTWVPRTISVDIHAEVNSTVFEIRDSGSGSRRYYNNYKDILAMSQQNMEVVINPRFEDGAFEKAVSAVDIAQEIERYMNNEMVAVNTVEPRPITDVEKAEAKGFDKKISFRHRK